MPLSERLSSKFHSCPRNNCSLFGQSFSVGHYPPIYQPTKGVYLLNTFRKLKGIIFINTVLFYNILRVWGFALRARAPLTVNQRKSGRWILGEQGWHSGESARLPPMWPGFDSRSRCHMWVEFVVGSRLCSERFFSGYSGFPLSSKTNISKFQFDPEPEGHNFVSPRLLCVTLVKQSWLIEWLID